MKKLNENGINKIKSFLNDSISSDANKIDLRLEHIAKLAKIGIITESSGDGLYYCYDTSIMISENSEIIEPDNPEGPEKKFAKMDKRELEHLAEQLSLVFPTKNEINDLISSLKDQMVTKEQLADIIK